MAREVPVFADWIMQEMLPEVLAFARMTNFVRGRGDSSLRWNRNAEFNPNDNAKSGL